MRFYFVRWIISKRDESVREAFTGPVENGVQKVLRSKKYLDSKKRFYYEATKTNAKYVIPK